MPIAAFLLDVALAVCPPEFRRAYRAAIHADFADRHSEEIQTHGSLRASAYAVGAYADVIGAGLRERAAMIARDLVYAMRSLRRTPLFTAIVIATLAVAIGANAAAFSLLDGVLFKPLPYADPGSLVAVFGVANGRLDQPLSYPNFADLRSGTRSFTDLAAATLDRATMTGHGAPRALRGQAVSFSYFDVFGVRPRGGRFFTPADSRAGAARALVLSSALFDSAFGGDPSIVGSSVQLDGAAYRIVGIAPPSFAAPTNGGFAESEYWTVIAPGHASGDDQRGSAYLSCFGRLRPGVSLAAARSDIHAVVARLIRRYVAEDKHLDVRIVALDETLLGPVRPLLWGVFAAVAGVLLVACANVANLLLSRAASRERELAVRYAVGASRARIVAQILTETLLLAVVGGALGALLGALSVRAFVALKPPGIPRLDGITLDGGAAVFTFACVVFCTLAAGLIPALTLSRLELDAALKAAGRGGDRSRGARARAAFVVAEIAITLALVVASGLVVRSFIALTNTPLGFDPAGVSTVNVASLPERTYSSEPLLIAFEQRAVERAAAVPGVIDAAWSAALPFHGGYTVSFNIPNRPLPPGDTRSATFNIVSAGYFNVLRIPLERGRLFNATDDRHGVPVLIVNDTFARTFFGAVSPLGKQLTVSLSAGDGKLLARTIVGIAADTRSRYAQEPRPEIYFPNSQIAFFPNGSLLVRARTGVEPAALSAVIPALDPLLAGGDVQPLANYLADDAARMRVSALALAVLAAIALLLAAAGIYAVVSYGVAQRTREFGIRKALGARRSHVLGDVLVRAVRLAAAGVLVGLILAGFAARLVAAQLYEVGVVDPLTYVAVVAILFVTAMTAALIPALRAMRVDPVIALRYE
jgi:putative ABC transport system permease protein